MITSRFLKPYSLAKVVQGGRMLYKPMNASYLRSSLLNPSMRTFFTVAKNPSRINPIYQAQYQYNLLNPFYCASFSVKMDRVRAKMARKKGNKKYKLKTNKAARKRFFIVGSIRDKRFQYKSSNARHLMRNKSRSNKIKKRKMKVLDHPGSIKYIKKLLPYYKKTRR